MRRLISLIPFFLVAATANATDAIGLKITRFGIEDAYRQQQGVVWLQIEAQNNGAQTQSALIRAFEADLDAFARPTTYSYSVRVKLSPSEKQTIDIPLRLANNERNTVLYAEAISESGLPLGHAARRLPHQTDGKLVGLLCASEAICKSIRQTVLLSGTAEEQTRKSQGLRLIQLQRVPTIWWAYTGIDTIVIAAQASNFSKEETDALEAFALRGGRLVLAEKEMGGFRTAGAPFASTSSLATDGLLTPAGWGTLARVASISSADFSNYFRPYGFATSTPSDVVALYAQFRERLLADPQRGLASWLQKRTATQFKFPGLLELVLWMTGYLLLMLGISFFLPRRLGKPEVAWVTIPILALVFSVILYKVSARNRPTDYGLEETRYYQLDGDNTLALADCEVQISAPKKGSVQLSAPGNFVYQPPQGYMVDSWGPEDRASRESNAGTEIKLGETWKSNVFLRVWSSRSLSFEFTHRFRGSVVRTGDSRLSNATGVDFDEAILVTHDAVYLLGSLAPGATADLSAVKKVPYDKIAGYRSEGVGWLASPPFAIGSAGKNAPGLDFPNGEWTPEPGKPFNLQEIVRGWPIDADRVFVQTKAVFFGKGKDVENASTLGDTAAQHRSVSVYSVTYRNWK
ncbi:MAG TPA: DUF4350 domain-containing protein [Candidatus Acidoferrum sp.]|nr:DUF4350 domain-containing protein [Candidatus Acidoferrum sp.]